MAELQRQAQRRVPGQLAWVCHRELLLHRLRLHLQCMRPSMWLVNHLLFCYEEGGGGDDEEDMIGWSERGEEMLGNYVRSPGLRRRRA